MKLIFITTCITLTFLFGCTKKQLPAKEEHSAPQPESDVARPVNAVISGGDKPTPESEKAFTRMLGSNLRFIGSLEKEVLNLLLPSSSPEVNQFEVLAYGFDKFNGAKTGFLNGFGCQKIAVRGAAKKFEVFSECTKPAKKLAEISEDLGRTTSYTVVFLTSNWKVILGNAAGINPERVCHFTLKDNKVQTMDCQDTVFGPRVSGLDINLHELKIRKYSFNRNQAEELVIEGGQFRDMIEIKKINLTVPISGKISIIEKELKVKDDFADMQNKLLGLEEVKPVLQEIKQDKTNEEKSGKEEAITPHTAEPEYINEAQASSGTAQSEEQNSQPPAQESYGEQAPEQHENQSVPPQPPEQHYGR